MDANEYRLSYELEESHWFFRGQRFLLNQFLHKYFKGRKNLKILDVGCGTGFNLSVLEEFGDVTGIDISEQAKRYCEKRGYKIQICSVMDIRLPSDHFDVVTSLGVFYHRGVSDDQQGFREIWKIL